MSYQKFNSVHTLNSNTGTQRQSDIWALNNDIDSPLINLYLISCKKFVNIRIILCLLDKFRTTIAKAVSEFSDLLEIGRIY